MAYRHLRRHWKKYVGAQCAGMFLTSYLTRKLRERNVIREYCHVAKKFGEEKTSMLEKPKRVMIFLNRTANNSNAKIHFLKYAAPLFHLSGIDVTVVESEYQGHIQMLMNYVDPTTDGIVVAGGDGTVMEVLNGMLRRQDTAVAKKMTLGILPLGKENHSFKSLFPSESGASLARSIGSATMRVLYGLTRQVPVMEIQPEKGHTLYALSSVQWGVLKEALQSKDRFWVFGKLRLLASCLYTAIREWPGDNSQSLWRVESPSVRAEEDIAGFTLQSSSPNKESLSCVTWPLSLLPKSTFLKYGWHRTLGRCKEPAGQDRVSTEFILTPLAPSVTSQVSVDGEQYEPVPIHVRLKHNHITVFI